VDVPRNPKDHLRQRRRIHVGNAQVAAKLGRPPTTAFSYLFENPARAVRALRRALAQPHAVRHLAKVGLWETVAHVLAAWDRLPPRRDHVRWSRITASVETPPRGSNERLPAVGPDARMLHRVRTLLAVAQEFRDGIPLSRLAELLPGPTATSERELEEILARRPDIACLKDGGVYPADPAHPSDPERVQRGIRYRQAADLLVRQRLAWLHRWVRCIGVTGSTAYGAPEPGDDLDFYVVTRRGSAAWFLLATYLTLRLARFRKRDSGDPTPCFNYVVDDLRAPGEFARARGLLFAREALTTQIVLGDDYYRGLLAQAPWLSSEIPQLYARRTVAPGAATSETASFPVRCLNALSFLPLASYLQFAGLVRNARARKWNQPSAAFRTLTASNGFVFQSQRFEELRRWYDRPPDSPPSYVATGSPSRIPTLR